jgi:hypothetical protein
MRDEVKLRIGLFADAPRQPRWIVEAFVRVAASDCAAVVIVAERSAPTVGPPWWWRVYARAERGFFRVQPDPSERIELRAHLPPVRALTLPESDAAPDVVATWREEVAAQRLDVAFALGDVDDGALASLAKFGVWRHCFGAQWGALETLAVWREVMQWAPVTASGLTGRRERGAPEQLLYRSWSRTFPFSVERNRANVLRKTAQFAERALQALQRLGPAWLEQCPPLLRAAPRPAEGMPNGGEIAHGLARIGGRIAHRALQKLLNVDQWFIAYRFDSGARWTGDLRGFTHLMPPRDRYWADPFPIARGRRHFIFFEELLFATGKAHIVVIEVDRNGACSAPQRVLERDYHLSYPFLVELGDELFMIPESGANRTVELYRCIDFPHRWRLERTLLRGALFADATLHRADDRWWMFVNIGVEGAESHDELHLYCADHLFGEWQPHHGNPVKSDVRGARPAGRLFERDGALYRPAQICAPLYGSGVSLNRVLQLSPQAYVEQEDERIVATHPAGLLGMHTLNRAGELSVLDAFVRRRRLGKAALSGSEFARSIPNTSAIAARASSRYFEV